MSRGLVGDMRCSDLREIDNKRKVSTVTMSRGLVGDMSNSYWVYLPE